MTASEERADAAERRRQCREQRQAIRREWERDLAGPPPFRVTLAQARARWPEWEAVQGERRADSRRAATEKAGVVVARLLTDIHLPKLPDPTETVAYALDLECGHEIFLLDKQDADAEPAVDRAPCPIFWKCQLNGGRTVVRYIAPVVGSGSVGRPGIQQSADMTLGHSELGSDVRRARVWVVRSHARHRFGRATVTATPTT